MQDKELDELFFSNLNDFEMEPSDNVWAGITQQLDEKPVRRLVFTPLLKVAATVTVIVTAGLLWMANKPQVADDQNNIAVTKPVKVPVTEKVEVQTPVLVNTEVDKTPVKLAVAKANTVKAVTVKKATAEVKATEQATNSTETPVIRGEAGPILAMQQQPTEILSPVVPDATLAMKEAVDEAPAFKTATPALAQVVEKAPKAGKKHRIHNLGDLVNVLVSKVDKRQDKLIEFSETKDEDSQVTGINLGIIKLKSEK